MTARINYLELPVADTGAAKAFYGAAFGWSFTDFGPTYAATTSGDTDIGFQADATGKTAAALPVIEVDDLEAAEAAVWTARSEEHTSELQSLMRISYAVFCLKKQNKNRRTNHRRQ